MKSLIKLSIIALTAISLFTACSDENKEVTETTTSTTSQVSNAENQSAENTNIIASENDTEITLSENANIPSFEDIIKKCDKNTKYDSILRIDYNDGYALMSNNKVMLKTYIFGKYSNADNFDSIKTKLTSENVIEIFDDINAISETEKNKNDKYMQAVLYSNTKENRIKINIKLCDKDGKVIDNIFRTQDEWLS